MHGSRRTAKTKKRTAPLQRSRPPKQKPRSANNEEFAITILPFLAHRFRATGRNQKPDAGDFSHSGHFSLTAKLFPSIIEDFSYLPGFAAQDSVEISRATAKTILSVRRRQGHG